MNENLQFYLCAINVLTFGLFGIDKWKAKRKRWRISEKTLLLASLIGGSLGGICAMQLFRHKTRHWYFVWGLPAMLVLQAVAIYFLQYR